MIQSHNEQNLKEAIDAMLRRLGLQAGYDRVAVYQAWDTVVGDMIVRHTVSLRLKNRILYAKIDSAVVRQELALEKSQICRKINEMTGKDLVQELVLL